jgi:hypothetical protein
MFWSLIIPPDRIIANKMGDLGDKPRVHLWRLDSCDTYQQIDFAGKDKLRQVHVCRVGQIRRVSLT